MIAGRQLWKFPSRSEPDVPAQTPKKKEQKKEQSESDTATPLSSTITKQIWPFFFSEKEVEKESVKPEVPVDFAVGKKSPLYDLDFVLSKIPAKILDNQMKESLQDLAKLAEGIYDRIDKQPDHPIVLNIALLRMYALQSHLAERAAQEEELDELDDEFRVEALHYFKYASEVYEEDPSIPRQDIVLNQLEDDKSLKIPRHVVFLDHLTKSIVVAIRGTKSISDIVTDLYIEASPFLDESREVFAHRGIAESAEALLPTVTAAIREIKQRDGKKFKNYRVVTTGHSLGAGSAALLAILLSTESKIPVSSFAYAPPPIISEPTVHEPRYPLKFFNSDAPCDIHSFVNDRDFITRCSHRELLHSLSGLEAIDSLPWTDFERSSIVYRNKLSDEEMKSIKDALEMSRGSFDDFRDPALYVPGKIYLLRPIPTVEGMAVKAVPGPSSSSAEHENEQGVLSKWQQLVKRTTDSVDGGHRQIKSTSVQPADAMVVAAAAGPGAGAAEGDKENEEKKDKAEKKRDNQQFALVAVPRAQLLFNGLLYYGDTMVSDHLLSSYRRALFRLTK